MALKDVEARRAYQRERSRDPRVRARRRELERARTPSEASLEKRRAWERVYRAANKAKVLAAARRSYAKNVVKRVHASRIRYAKAVAFLAGLKKGPCLDCGGHFHPAAMDFDHVRGEKKFCIAARKYSPLWMLEEESKKCDLVCANCHRVRTWQRKQRSA